MSQFCSCPLTLKFSLHYFNVSEYTFERSRFNIYIWLVCASHLKLYDVTEMDSLTLEFTRDGQTRAASDEKLAGKK